jgi:hypothetical protein
VHLDGERAWPPADYPFPPPAIRTVPEDGPIRVGFGSCRVTAPHEPPYTLTKDQDPRGREVDALYALALRMLQHPKDQWPHVMMRLGDQVYADEVSPEVLEFISGRRDLRHHPALLHLLGGALRRRHHLHPFQHPRRAMVGCDDVRRSSDGDQSGRSGGTDCHLVG